MEGFATLNRNGQNGTTGGAGGELVTVSNFAEFIAAVGDNTPRIVQVQGTISGADPVMVSVGSHKTIIGLGNDATLVGFGLDINGFNADVKAMFNVDSDDWCDEGYTDFPYVHNVIVRNLTFRDYADDGINVACFTHHVWLDHNTFLAGHDGALDIKRGSDWITVSWNVFEFTYKTMLLGHDDSFAWSDAGRLHVTYHHNYFKNTTRRHPRVRFGQAHVYNNFAYQDTTEYPDGSGGFTIADPDVFIEAGTDADIYAEGNYINGKDYRVVQEQGSGAKVTWTDTNIVELGKDIEVNTGDAFVPSSYYTYHLDDAALLPTLLPAQAGAGKITITP